MVEGCEGGRGSHQRVQLCGEGKSELCLNYQYLHAIQPQDAMGGN